MRRLTSLYHWPAGTCDLWAAGSQICASDCSFEKDWTVIFIFPPGKTLNYFDVWVVADIREEIFCGKCLQTQNTLPWWSRLSLRNVSKQDCSGFIWPGFPLCPCRNRKVWFSGRDLQETLRVGRLGFLLDLAQLCSHVVLWPQSTRSALTILAFVDSWTAELGFRGILFIS